MPSASIRLDSRTMGRLMVKRTGGHNVDRAYAKDDWTALATPPRVVYLDWESGSEIAGVIIAAMAMRSFQVMLEWDSEENVWVTYVPTLDFHSTYGQTKEEAVANTREAILGYMEAASKEGILMPYGSCEAELVSIDIQVA